MDAPNPKKVSAEMWKTGGAGNLMGYDNFKSSFLKSFVIENKKSEILDAFEVFDYEKKGTIYEAEVRLIFSTMGNQLDSGEISELVKLMKPDKEGKCDYKDFVNRMFIACKEKS